MQYLDRHVLAALYKRRKPWVHKGSYGRLVLVCGSERHTGSACFAGMAAYRAGTDLVHVIAPERAADVAANYSPTLMTTPLPGPMLEQKHLDTVMDAIREVRATAAVIGPGLWRHGETLNAITGLLAQVDIPLVIDADAIRAVGRQETVPLSQNCVFTPHAGEFKELTRASVDERVEKRARVVEKEAGRLDRVILLKGHVDVVSDGKKTMLNRTGTPFMTKGGLGDTLAGICGSYLARGADCFTAACAGAYVNGRAGEIASRSLGESLLPTDLIESIHKVIGPGGRA